VYAAIVATSSYGYVYNTKTQSLSDNDFVTFSHIGPIIGMTLKGENTIVVTNAGTYAIIYNTDTALADISIIINEKALEFPADQYLVTLNVNDTIKLQNVSGKKIKNITANLMVRQIPAA